MMPAVAAAKFDNITPEDFIHGGGSGHGNPPGWLAVRHQPGAPSDAHRVCGDRARTHR